MAQTVTVSKPPKQFKKGYRLLARAGEQAFKDTDSKPWEGDRVANFNTAQRDAFDTIGSVANANTAYSDQMLDTIGGIAGGDGLAKGMGQPLRWIENVGSGAQRITTGSDYNQVANQMARLGDNAGRYSGVDEYKKLYQNAGDNLDYAAKGGYLKDGGNKYLDDIVRQARENTLNTYNARAAGSGAYGGRNYADTVSRGLADVESQLRYKNYGDERNWQQQADAQVFGQRQAATQGLSGARQQDFNNRLSTATTQMGALAGQQGAEQANITNQLGAAGQTAGIRQQGQANVLAAAGLSPSLQQASFLGGQALLGMGDRMQGQDQKEIDAQKAYSDELRDAPWTHAGKLGQLLGMGGSYGTQSQTSQANLLEGILGGLAGIGGLFGTAGIGGLFK